MSIYAQIGHEYSSQKMGIEFGFRMLHLISFCILFCYIPYMVSSAPSVMRLPLPSPGPEAFAFDIKGEGPYTAVADGRILKYEGHITGFVDFAYTAPNRNKTFCDGTNRTDLASECGRGLGLGFYYKTGELFIADAAYGLVKVGPRGGLATQIADGLDGIRFVFPDGLDVDQATGIVYFTDVSATYGIDQVAALQASNDSTGRLLKYDPKTKNVTVLLGGLSSPAGVAISEDGSFLLLTELRNRVQKFWLTGPKSNTAEVLLNLSGSPDNIKRTEAGDFWVAVTVVQNQSVMLTGERINDAGNVLERLTFSPQFSSSSISEVQEFKDNLFLGSVNVGYVGVVQLLSRPSNFYNKVSAYVFESTLKVCKNFREVFGI